MTALRRRRGKKKKSFRLFPTEQDDDGMFIKILFFASLILFFNNESTQSIELPRVDLYGHRVDRSQLKLNIKSLEEAAKQQYRLVRSPTFVQSRRFHPEQYARDQRDLNQPFSFTGQVFSSYYYSYGGPGTNLAISSQEGCRLTSNFCSKDYQCCSGKCRCVRWSTTGQMSCWKKCF